MDLPLSYQFGRSRLLSEEEIIQYLHADMEIWPHAPIGRDRLLLCRGNPEWVTLFIRDRGELIASVMVWRERDGSGVIEDVFVRKPWRKQGLVK